MRRVNAQPFRFLEALGVCFVCSTVFYVVPCLWRRCTPKPLVQVTWTDFEKGLVEELVPFGCPADSYNEVASLFFTDSDTAIKQLFHFRESGVFNQDVQTFSSLAIATFYVPYFLCACLTYGIAVPSGLFVPSLLSGAALGRLVGHLLHRLDAQSGTFADSGTRRAGVEFVGARRDAPPPRSTFRLVTLVRPLRGGGATPPRWRRDRPTDATPPRRRRDPDAIPPRRRRDPAAASTQSRHGVARR